MTKPTYVYNDADKSTHFDGAYSLCFDMLCKREPFTFTRLTEKRGSVVIDGDFDADGKYKLSASVSGFDVPEGGCTHATVSKLLSVRVFANDVCELTSNNMSLPEILGEYVTEARKKKDVGLLELALQLLDDHENIEGKPLFANGRNAILKRIDTARAWILANPRKTKVTKK